MARKQWTDTDEKESQVWIKDRQMNRFWRISKPNWGGRVNKRKVGKLVKARLVRHGFVIE